jgi:hypothetical protein
MTTTDTDFAEMFGDSGDQARPVTEITDAGILASLRALEKNRRWVERVEEDSRELTDYLVEVLDPDARLVWRDEEGRLRPVRVTKPSQTFEPSQAGLAWLKAQHPQLHALVTKTVLDVRAYHRALTVTHRITPQMHDAMISRDDDGNPVPSRTRRASVVLPQPRPQQQPPEQEENGAPAA